MTIEQIILLFLLVSLSILGIAKYKLKSKEMYKRYTLKKLEPNQIDREILIKLAIFEKFIYLSGFTRRVIIEYKDKKSIFYRVYYYNLLNGIHLYIEINSKELNDKYNFLFATKFRNSEFITYNDSYIESIKDITSSKNRAKYPLATLEELYEKHLKKIESINDEIVNKRLTLKELLQNRTSTYIIQDKKSEHKILKKIIIFLLLLFIVAFVAYIIQKFYMKRSNSLISAKVFDYQQKIVDLDKELEEFNRKVKNYKKLTLNLSGSNFQVDKSLKIIDDYLKESKINRRVGENLVVKSNNNDLLCPLPLDLVKLYRWHNGVERFIPNRDFYKYSTLIDNYKKYNKNNKSDYIIIFGNKDGSKGLAINCNKRGLYEYNAVTKKAAQKEFYSIAHFLKIVSSSYKNNAFYDDENIINIDMKKFMSIYREYLTKMDKNRYKTLLKYIENRAIMYRKYGNKKLKIALLNEIDKLYDTNLSKSVELYLVSTDKDIKLKAINIISKIGNKSHLKELKKNLHSKNNQIKDFTLIAISNIIDKNDTHILKDIYPLLKSKSTFVKLSAYKVIAKLANKKSLNIIRDMFKKEDERVKIGIIRALSMIGESKDIEVLKKYLLSLPKTDLRYSEYIRGSKPNPLILEYEIKKAIANIKERTLHSYKISSSF